MRWLAWQIYSKYDWTTAKGKQEDVQELNDPSKTDSKLVVLTYKIYAAGNWIISADKKPTGVQQNHLKGLK